MTIPAGVSDDIDGDTRPIGKAPDIGADEYGDPPSAAVTDLHVTQVLTGTGIVTITLEWSPPLNTISQTVRFAHDPITRSNWDEATLLTENLIGSASSTTAVIPYTNGTVYFAHKSFNTAGGWSALSNNAYWPRFEIYLPLVYR